MSKDPRTELSELEDKYREYSVLLSEDFKKGFDLILTKAIGIKNSVIVWSKDKDTPTAHAFSNGAVEMLSELINFRDNALPSIAKNIEECRAKVEKQRERELADEGMKEK